MERLTIKKEQIKNKANSDTAKALVGFMIEKFYPEITIIVFKQENPGQKKVPAQLNSYAGHKLIGTYDEELKIFDAYSMEEEDISEIMTHQDEVQWKS